MVKEHSIPASKALVGAIFMQYFIYSLLYMAEACQYEKLRGKQSGAHDHAKGDVQQVYEMDIKDVMNHEKGLSRTRSLRSQKSINEVELDQIQLDEEVKQEDEEGADGEVVENKTEAETTDHWLTIVVNSYHKSTVWFVVAIALCALKGATGFAVFLAYTQVVFRGIQMIAMIYQKRKVARFAYGAATAATVGLFLIAAITDVANNLIE